VAVQELGMTALGSKVKSSWSPPEEAAFVAGLRHHGRAFHNIQVRLFVNMLFFHNIQSSSGNLLLLSN
jgi:hypothetical protein